MLANSLIIEPFYNTLNYTIAFLHMYKFIYVLKKPIYVWYKYIILRTGDFITFRVSFTQKCSQEFLYSKFSHLLKNSFLNQKFLIILKNGKNCLNLTLSSTNRNNNKIIKIISWKWTNTAVCLITKILKKLE